MRESFGLYGQVDVYLFDGDNLIKHVSTHNQLTEAFARWFMLGGLGAKDTDTVLDVQHTGNAISHLLFSSPYQKTTDPSNLNPNLKQGYQIAVSSCGYDYTSKDPDDYDDPQFQLPRFGIYLLDCDVNIQPNTSIPPVFGVDLVSVNPFHSILYSTADQEENYPNTFAKNISGRSWSNLRSNPLFTSSFVRTRGKVNVKSIVMGASFKTSSPNLPCISIRQSPAEIQENWESAEDAEDAVYLIVPFIRSSRYRTRYADYRTLDGVYGGERFCDGLYGTGKDRITFWDYGTGTFFADPGVVYNPITNENYASSPTGFIHDNVAGGFALGNGRAIRVDRATEEYRNEECIGRSVRFVTQDKLTDFPDPKEYDSPILYATEGTTIPSTIVEYCSPVMVAQRGYTPSDDRIEIFVSLGVGTFTEYTDEQGYHPGGTGVEIHKLVLYIDHYRYTASSLSHVLTDNPELLVNYGRVAVLPFAIGFKTNSSQDSGLSYLVGSYDTARDIYHLPITHILKGVDLLDNSFDFTSTEPILCASDKIQPGVEYYGCGWDFIRTCILGFDSTRIVYLATTEGHQPIAVNRRQRWNTLTSMVMSGVNLPETVTKEENQRLVIDYSYGFEVIKPFGISSFSIAEDLQTDTFILTVNVFGNGVHLSIHRSLYFIYAAYPSSSKVTFVDETVPQAKKCTYIASCFNGATRETSSITAWSPYKHTSHGFLILSSDPSSVTPEIGQMIADPSTGQLYLDERAGTYEPRWYSTATQSTEFEDYEVREIPEEFIDVAPQVLKDGIIVICPERRQMYIVLNHSLITLTCSDIRSI